MPCTHPLTALRLTDNSVVIVPSHSVVDGDSPVSARYIGRVKKVFYVPCGKCHNCRCNRTRMWAVRIMHEAARPGSSNIFATLTYDNDNIPYSPQGWQTLYKPDFVRFIKNVRRDFGTGIRYYQCGEYGHSCQVCEKPRTLCECPNYVHGLGRPHHHAALFNISYDDAVFYKSVNGIPYYTSSKLSEHWPHGIACFGELTYEAAAYIAGYLQKKLFGDIAAEHYLDREPEYTSMSLRPGIGGDFLKKYYDDIYPHDKFHFRGKTLRPGRYYDKLYGRMDGNDLETIKLERERWLDQYEIYTPESVLANQKLEPHLKRRINRDRIDTD